MAFHYRDLIVNVFPEATPGDCEHTKCAGTCGGNSGACCPSGKASKHGGGGVPKRNALDLAALRQQVRETLAGAP